MRDEAAARKRKEALRLKLKNAALKAKLQKVKAKTDHDLTDEVAQARSRIDPLGHSPFPAAPPPP